MAVQAVARSPAIGGANSGPRKAPEKFPVWHPDGHLEMHTNEVINDLVRHGTWCDTGETDEDGKPIKVQLTWTMVDPSLSALKRAQREAILRNGQVKAGLIPPPEPQVQASAGASDPTVVPRLSALRAEFTKLGGVVDQSWGVAKLTQEIAAKNAASPASD